MGFRERDMESRISLNCPDCNAKIKIKNVRAGQIISCESCRCKIKFTDYGYNRLAFDKWEEPAKPPLGLMPKKIHNELRLNDIVAAIVRYMNNKEQIPEEWIKEYNELTKLV
jgi:hypothetical protein